MGTFALPPGFRFHPTDEELISCYLKGKLNHGLKAAELEVISEVDLYKLEPWDLPEKSFLPSTDMEWYFFSPRDRKYPNGSRTNRATEAGYWKATGRDRKIYSRASTIGIKKTLVFYRGRAPQGERTDWVMHEYRLEENESEAGPCLQNAFVLCRVFKKSGLGEKSGEQYTAPVEKGDLSLIKKNLSPGYFGDIEVHSEEQSKPVEGIDANSHLPSKISSKILNDTTGDSAPLNKWLDILLDDTNSNSSCVALDEDTIHTQVDAMPDTPRTQCDSACLPFDESEFPQIPVNISFSQYGVPNVCLDAYFEEERMLDEMLSAASQDYTNSKAYHSFLGDTFADILNGGYIKVKHLLPSMEELENRDSCLWEVPNPSLHHEGTGIQICSRSPVLQSHKQGILSEGTAARRVRMQLHKMEDSVERNEKDVNVRHSQNMSNDWYDSKSDSTICPQMQQLHFDQFDGHKCNSENIRENEDSVPEALATYMAGRIDVTVSGLDTIINPGNSSPAMSMRNKISNPKTNDQTSSERYLLDSNKPSITEHVQKSEHSASKNAIGILTQAACLGKDSPPEKVLHNSRTSLEHGPQMKELELNSSETMVVGLHNEDPKPSKILSKFLSCIPASPGSAMDCNASLNPAKGILDLNIATNSGLVCVATTNGHVSATSLISTCSIEGVVFPASDTVSSRLRFRRKLESKNILFVDEEKTGVVMDESYGRCDKQHINGTSLSFEQSRQFFSLFSQLRKRLSSTGSLAVFLVARLFGTTFFIFFSCCHGALGNFRTFPLLYFSKASSHYKTCSVFTIDDSLTVILDAG